MLKNINNKIKNIIYMIFFSLLILVFLVLIIMTRDSSKIIEIKEYIKTDEKILYITNDESLKYPIEILDKYSVSYLKINSNKLNMFEKKKLKNIINNQYINNIIVILKNGEVIDALIEYDSKEKVNMFLQEHNIIPKKIVDNVNEIVDKSKTILENDYSMIYILYSNHDKIDKQDKLFQKISKKYSINYDRIDAYLLSESQQDQINTLLGLSEVEDQILVLIKDKKMIANIRGIHSQNTYVEALYDQNFIKELDDKINKIDYDDLKKELEKQDKNIILIGQDICKDCDQVYNLLNGMIYNYNINVNYINLENSNSNIYDKVKNKLIKSGYTDAFSLPLVIIVENNKIIDYVIGNSNEEYFLDIFIQNGVIKGDVIDE